MGLQNYIPERHQISIGGENTMSIRGLALSDISTLINAHLPDIEALFDLFFSGNHVHTDDMRPLVMGIVKDAPGFAANLIAVAADEREAAQQAEMLPFPIQVNAILKIGDLTFKEVGGVKKGMEGLAALLNLDQIKKTLPKMTGKKAG